MKVKVNRLLNNGRYHISFDTGDFTVDEVEKMTSFGVPRIEIKSGFTPGLSVKRLPITQISKEYEAAFLNEESALEYEKAVMSAIKLAMDELRRLKDEYSSSDEVEL